MSKAVFPDPALDPGLRALCESPSKQVAVISVLLFNALYIAIKIFF